MYVLWVRCHFELAQVLSRVALALHKAGSSAPLGVTGSQTHVLPPFRENKEIPPIDL